MQNGLISTIVMDRSNQARFSRRDIDALPFLFDLLCKIVFVSIDVVVNALHLYQQFFIGYEKVSSPCLFEKTGANCGEKSRWFFNCLNTPTQFIDRLQSDIHLLRG